MREYRGNGKAECGNSAGMDWLDDTVAIVQWPLPCLAAVAKALLALPATETSSERILSLAGRILSLAGRILSLAGRILSLAGRILSLAGRTIEDRRTQHSVLIAFMISYLLMD